MESLTQSLLGFIETHQAWAPLLVGLLAFGESLVLRLLRQGGAQKTLAQVMPRRARLILEKALGHPHGLVLVTGPTGSGKTTTLYAALDLLNKPDVKIMTAEDPVEFNLPGINQVQMKEQIGLNFAAALRSFLRQDPNIVLVGEIRDFETAEIAIKAALTGHLVLSTLHTNDAPSAVTRMLDLGIPAYLINSTLLGVMAQRLVRTLCPQCKAPIDPPDDAAWQAITSPWRAEKPVKTMGAVGCLECRMTGYRGRTGLYEIFLTDEKTRQLVTDDPDLPALRRHAMQSGMRPLRLAGAMRVASGLTTVDEILRNTPPIES